MSPTFSIITPSYNSSKFILETYNSIARQTVNDWEWIVTDDHSTDETLQILEKIALRDKRVIILKNNKNLGAAEARNKSLSFASGRFYAFIDSDDLWNKYKLEKQSAFMIKNKAPICFTSYGVIGENGCKKDIKIDWLVPSKINYHDLLAKKATFGCSTVMIDSSTVGKIKMPSIRTGQDYATWLSLLKKGFIAHSLKEILSFYRIVPGSISRNKYRKALRQWNIYRNQESLTLASSIYYFASYAYRAVFRK